MNEKFCISIRILLKFVPEGPIDSKRALVQVMAWCRRDDKPLHEPMLTHFTDAYVAPGRDELKRLGVTIYKCNQYAWGHYIQYPPNSHAVK